MNAHDPSLPGPPSGEPPRAVAVKLGARLFGSARQLIKVPFYWLYERRLARQQRHWRLPRHIGFIMDGNRRFARALGFDHVSEGHSQGAHKLWEVLSWCYDAGIPVVTVWGFSIDNFQRDAEEVELLLDLLEEKTRELAEHPQVHEKRVRVRYIGELDRLPLSLQVAIAQTEARTAVYADYELNIAIAYGGREEITGAFRRYLKACAAAGQSLESVADALHIDSLAPHLYTSGQPEPDLILRTSGEVRLSGFLLWQSAYSEYYFSDTHWPAFRRVDFLRALRTYDQRNRRFGR